MVHVMAPPGDLGEDKLLESDEMICGGTKDRPYPKWIAVVFHPDSVEFGPGDWYCPACEERSGSLKQRGVYPVQ